MIESETCIDLNCDLGEDASEQGTRREMAVLEFVSSINVACGLHAGDAHVMRRIMQAASARGIAVGAHPSLDDRSHFGRRELPVTAEEAYELVTYQVGAAQAIAKAAGARLNHVKPHGALYNMAARDAALADAIARAVRDFDAGLVLCGLSGSQLIVAAEANGLRCAGEVFADRTYRADGSLTARSRPDALIADEEIAVAQVLGMLRNGSVRSVDGEMVKVRADTVCIHGDAPQTPVFAAKLRRALEAKGICVRPIPRG
jgi:UPF0271 protein